MTGLLQRLPEGLPLGQLLLVKGLAPPVQAFGSMLVPSPGLQKASWLMRLAVPILQTGGFWVWSMPPVQLKAIRRSVLVMHSPFTKVPLQKVRRLTFLSQARVFKL